MIKHRVTIWPNICNLRYIPKRNENVCPHGKLYINIGVLSHSVVSDSYQAPLSMGFPRQEFWSELQFHSPGDLPDLGLKQSPALETLPLSHLGSLVRIHSHKIL